MKIVITDERAVLDEEANNQKSMLERDYPNAQVDIVPFTNKSEWLREIADADAVITSYLKFDKECFDGMHRLKCIAINASGYDCIDVGEATKHNVAVMPIEEYCTQEVCEHTIALMFALTRKLKIYDHMVCKDGLWDYSLVSGVKTISGKTLGIVGFGKIGRKVASTALALGMNVMVYSNHLAPEEASKIGVKPIGKNELLEESDIISNHMAMANNEPPFFDEIAFSAMKKMPIFINVGRGNAVDENALIKALEKGQISGAGIDVLNGEPPEISNHPLRRFENVILTPHAAFYSEHSGEALRRIPVENTVNFLQGKYDKVHHIINDIVFPI